MIGIGESPCGTEERGLIPGPLHRLGDPADARMRKAGVPGAADVMLPLIGRPIRAAARRITLSDRAAPSVLSRTISWYSGAQARSSAS